LSGADAPERGEIAVDVAIVGAGPAGLTAGYVLAKAGKRVAIIEKDPTCVGGISRAVALDGYRFDLGGRHLSPESLAVAELWNEILPGGFTEHSRTRRIRYEGKLYSCPPRGFEALRGLGVWRSAACMMSYAGARLFPIRDVRSVTDWTSNRFGRKLHALFFKPYAEKVWGMPCDQLSADWAAQRLSGLSLRGAAADVLLRPRRGAGTMWEAARDRIVERGGVVLMGHSLKQLASDGQGGWRMTATGPDGEAVITASHAISSAPMRELAARLYPLPVSMIEASRLKYRDLVTVALTLRSDHPISDTCIYVNDSKVQAGRAQILAAGSPETAPDERIACIALEYFCGEGDALWSMRDERLIELARRELDVLGLVPPRGEMIGAAVVRQEKAYPVYDRGYAARVEAMRRELASNHPTLHLVGRTGAHRCGNVEYAMKTAMLTAENILAGRRAFEPWSVAEDAEYRERAERPLPAASALQPNGGNPVAAPVVLRESPRRAEGASPAPRKKVA
jgi:protoporphyrinogen oxidase